MILFCNLNYTNLRFKKKFIVHCFLLIRFNCLEQSSGHYTYQPMYMILMFSYTLFILLKMYRFNTLLSNFDINVKSLISI